jgi:hypothetical protein
LHIKFVLVFSKTLVRNISHSKKEWARYCHKCTQVFVKSTRYSRQILTKHAFFRTFSRNTQISNNTKIRPVGAELFHTDGRTDGQT